MSMVGHHNRNVICLSVCRERDGESPNAERWGLFRLARKLI
jgi:hypothetical protein